MSNQTAYPGSRWWKFDFHTHTPASSDYGSGPNQVTLKARTHREWIMDFINAGVQCVAVTDHHSGAWIDGLKNELEQLKAERLPEPVDFHIFPGVELSINGIHYLAIFGPDKSTSTINSLRTLARYDGNADNAQGICGETNAVKVCEEVERLDGLLLPAHVDLESTGLFRHTQNGVLRPMFDCQGIIAMEVASSGYQPPPIFQEAKVKWASVLGSDSHHPTAKSDGSGRFPGSHYTWVKMGEPSLESLKLALHDGNEFSLIRSDKAETNEDPNETPEEWIESLEITDARLMGRGQAAKFEFSPRMNAVIGGRGSGKSTLVHFIRLVTQRQNELRNLGEGNRVQRNLESFKKIGERRSDEGGLLEETKAVMVYWKGEQRFRLTWLQSGSETTVESFDTDAEEWQAASSQEVVNRFPLGIFSQDEVGLIAENPGALLRRVDEAIGKVDWDAKWENELNGFLALLGKVRSQRARLGEKERLKGELEDVTKKLVVLEKSEHAATFKAARRVRRQKDQMDSLFKAYERVVEEIGKLQEELLLHDLPEDLIDTEAPNEQALAEVDGKLRGAVGKAARILQKVRLSMSGVAISEKQALDGSDWEAARKETETKYQMLMEDLESKGLGDPAKFSLLAARRQALEKSLKEIEVVEKEIETLREEALKSRQRLLDLRVELQSMRKDFLNNQLGNNKYVRIELNPYGAEQDKDRVEAELREMLACEGSRFSDALRNPEKNGGFIDTLYPSSGATDQNELLDKIQTWKQQVVNAGRGRTTELSGAFQNFIKREIEKRPEFLDRLLAWWPEDSLSIAYSKGGRGMDFVSLRNGSAGEKAAALLAFFLAHGSNPLVIDQPENDLDNHLITDLVVKQLKENKKRRQVIVVTHNPNIVVNGDAEMVHAMRFESGQCRAKASGPLQNGEVRSEVCEVMEGGKLALISRYQRLI